MPTRGFFGPRATVLRAYEKRLGDTSLTATSDWSSVNHHWSFYIESLPTWSKKFGVLPSTVELSELRSKVFVCALNSVVHDVVLKLLRPRAILLAGQATWRAWPDRALAELGTNLSSFVRSKGKNCQVYRLVTQDTFGNLTTVVRTNFLRTVYGPNSNEELARLGDVLANAG